MPSDPIDAPWFHALLKACRLCPRCSERMTMEPCNPHKATADRLNNLFGHDKSNCRLLCLSCQRIIKDHGDASDRTGTGV